MTYVALVLNVMENREGETFDVYSIQKGGKQIFWSCDIDKAVNFADQNGYEIGCDGGPCQTV